jgi:hypothetical protein
LISFEDLLILQGSFQGSAVCCIQPVQGMRRGGLCLDLKFDAQAYALWISATKTQPTTAQNGNDLPGKSNAVVSIVARSAACRMNLENGQSIEVVFMRKDIIDKTPQASSTP